MVAPPPRSILDESFAAPTVAGIMTFSIYPQTYLPQLRITAVVVPGSERGVLGEDREQFIDNERIAGSVSEILDAAVVFVRRNSQTKTIIAEDGQRRDKPEYPVQTVRKTI